MSVPYVLQDRYRFPKNSLLYRALSSSPGSCIVGESRVYYLIDILFELFRYAGLNKLYLNNQQIICNEELRAIFKNRVIQAGAAVLHLKPHLEIQPAYFVYRPLHDALTREEFMTFIGRTIQLGNNLTPEWNKLKFQSANQV